ncbi:MAG: hypothetical protein ABIP67_17435 [Burkholderiales bacterium]
MKLHTLDNTTLTRARAVVWRGLTLLTCPCCIPIWIWVLSGTAAGALLSKNLYVTIAVFFVLFLWCAWKAFRSYGRDDDAHDNHAPGKIPGELPKGRSNGAH